MYNMKRNAQSQTFFLGGKVVTNPEDCTVLVTDKVYRTCKFLCAIAKGVIIVSIDWINAIERENRFIPPDNYILKDEPTEKRFKFKLTKSIAKAQQNPILRNYSIYVTPSTRPTPEELNGKHFLFLFFFFSYFVVKTCLFFFRYYILCWRKVFIVRFDVSSRWRYRYCSFSQRR